MAGIFETLHKIFDSELASFGFDNSIEVREENGSTTSESTSVPYLSGYLRLSPTESGDLGYNDLRSGFYQVDINYQSGTGMKSVNAMADLLNEKFKSGAFFTRDEICLEVLSTDLINLPKSSVSGGWVTVSLTINFNSYTKRI